jgi:hypothetical protein
LISTIDRNESGEKIIKYNEMKFRSVPKGIESIGANFYMYNSEGMTWFNRLNALAGFTDHKMYRTFINWEGMVIFVSLFVGELEWWPAHIFKTADEIERDKIDKLISERNSLGVKEGKNVVEENAGAKENCYRN